MRQPKRKVTLVGETHRNISVHLTAWTDDRGLVLEGQDLGPVVSSIWGDSDYEYWLTIEREHLDRVAYGLARKLNKNPGMSETPAERDGKLLALLEQAWKGGVFRTDVDFRRWLNAIHVPSKFSSYV